MKAFKTWRGAKRYIESFDPAHKLTVVLVEGTYLVGATDAATRLTRLDREGHHLSAQLLERVLPMTKIDIQKIRFREVG